MDQHPIPQDVTGFQFKLIGSMTVKQFGYVAVGVITAVILYYLPLQGAFGVVFKLFMIPLIGGSGFIIAFVPIEGRPIDLMATNFAKSIFSPNQYIYRKTENHFSFSTIALSAPQKQPEKSEKDLEKEAEQKYQNSKSVRLQKILLQSQGAAKTDIDKREMAFLKQFAAPTTPPVRATTMASAAPVKKQPQPVKPAVVAPAPKGSTQIPTPQTKEQETKTLAQQETILEQQLAQAKQVEAQQKEPQAHTKAHEQVALLEKELQDVHQQKQHLEEELLKVKQQLHQTTQAPAAPKAQEKTPVPTKSEPTIKQTAPQQAKKPTLDPAHVRSVPQQVTKQVGLPHVSDTPNVVTGIVKDPRGNVLSGMLVEVKDAEGNPVRAFKTNPLGQFASATPLSPGTYTIEIEDPKKQNQFKVIQITANNQIMLPIEIISQDAREQLRQALFN